MSEPDGAFLKLRIARPDLVRWLDSPPAPASRWLDWRSIGGQWYFADGPEEIVKAVRTNFKYGADFIKILATGAVLSKGITPGAQQYSDAEIQAAVTEATRWGRPVAAHAHGAEGIKAAIRAGVRTIDHGS